MATATGVPELSWADFREAFTWRQGEHVAAIGPTGCGKTTAVRELLEERRWVAVAATKRRDPVIDAFADRGYRRIPDWTVSDAELMPRVVLAPPITGFRAVDEQREVFRRSLDSIFRQGGWCLYLDEARYVTDFLGLGRECEILWQQGRSHGISMVAAAQRPRHLPLVAYDQAAHHFYWKVRDELMTKRLGEISGAADPDLVRSELELLGFHAMLYVNTETGEISRTQVPAELAR